MEIRFLSPMLNRYRQQAQQVMREEAAAILETANRLRDDFESVVELLLNHQGKIVLCGIGKSGFIAQKIAATLTSTGTKAVFLHPAEALHGDLGIYSPGDPTLLFSRSGATDELLTLVPILKHFESPLVAVVGNVESPLAHRCDYCLEAFVDREADPLEIVPTTSAITALAIGDALASSLMTARHFQREDFAQFHPGGQLGRSLLLRVSDVMRKTNEIACCSPQASIREVVVSMTEKPMGACCVLDQDMHLLGVITDGDIRRLLQRTENFHGIHARDIMTTTPRTIHEEKKLGDAIRIMESGSSQIYVLPVVDDGRKICGLLRLHDAYHNGRAGV